MFFLLIFVILFFAFQKKTWSDRVSNDVRLWYPTDELLFWRIFMEIPEYTVVLRFTISILISPMWYIAHNLNSPFIRNRIWENKTRNEVGKLKYWKSEQNNARIKNILNIKKIKRDRKKYYENKEVSALSGAWKALMPV